MNADYTARRKLFQDAYTVTYEALGNSGVVFHMTEFFPEEKAARDPDGFIRPEKSYEPELAAFLESARAWQGLNAEAFPHVIEIFKENQTAYAVWEKIFGISYQEYLTRQKKKISVQAAFELLRPLLTDLEKALKAGLRFPMDADRVFLTDGGLLRINAFPAQNASTDTLCGEIAHFYYTMITGVSFAPDMRRASEICPDIPPALDALLLDALVSRESFASPTDLGLRMLEAITADAPARQSPGPSPSGQSFGQSSGPSPSGQSFGQPSAGQSSGRRPLSTEAKLAIGCGGGGCLLFLILFAAGMLLAVNLIKNSASLSENAPSVTVAPPSWPSEYLEEDPDFYERSRPLFGYYVYTCPENENEIYDELVCEADGELFYCSQSDDATCLIRERADGSRTVLADHVSPKFIQATGGVIYYTDGFDSYRIYRIKPGMRPEKLTEQSAAYLRLFEDYLYFSNGEDWDSLYRLNLKTGWSEKLNDECSYELTIVGNNLFYTNDDDNARIYAMDLTKPDLVGRAVNDVPSCNIRRMGGRLDGNLVYLNMNLSRVEVMNATGEFIPFPYSISPYCFDVVGDDKIYYIDDDVFALHLLTLDGTIMDLSDHSCSYVIAAGGAVFFIDDDEDYRLFKLTDGGPAVPVD
ncbi:MAG: DUF5050 domain-containing protein [Clostridiales bacterium]|jgi:hypothetical protein|nr:DUF5050 domain-containing protein [Clostridiales bacterium]